MFDGNFRSRREVDFSTGSSSSRSRRNQQNRKRQSNNRQELLRNAEVLRRQRQEKQRRERGATKIQKTIRGWLTRLHVMNRFVNDNQLANLSLSLSLLQNWKGKKVSQTCRQRLVDFVSTLPAKEQEHEHGKEEPRSDYADADAMEITSNDDPHYFSKKRLVRIALQELHPQGVEPTDIAALFHLLQYYWSALIIDETIFLQLTYALQKWCKDNADHQITQTLCQWATQATATHLRDNPYAHALLATILLSSPNSSFQQLPKTGDSYKTWFVPLSMILQYDNNDTSHAAGSILFKAARASLHSGKERKILSNVLDSAPAPDDPTPLVHMIHHALSQDSGRDLAFFASLVFRGDAFDGKTSDDAVDEDVDDEEDEEDWERDDQVVENSTTTNNNNNSTMPTSAMTSAGKQQRSVSSRHTRRDILTMVKLDKTYQDKIRQVKNSTKNVTTPLMRSTKELASKIANAPWLVWGLKILSRKDGQVGNDNTSSSDNYYADNARRLYVECLSLLLQTSTSLRPSAKMGIMFSLSASKVLLESLWDYAKQLQQSQEMSSASSSSSSSSSQLSELALGVFCDLFSHHLVALSDSDFLRRHTAVSLGLQSGGQSQGQSRTSIDAQDVILRIKTYLHELYWSKPVFASDVDMYNPRGRLLLSGTKLWNSLYERWNRLIRYKFCDESTWWFPHLSSRDGDRAVLPGREDSGAAGAAQNSHRRRGRLGQQDEDDDDDDMDIDDEDDDDDDEDEEDDDGENNGISPAEAETDALADAFKDPKMARVLTCIPQSLPFGRRVKLFHSLLKADKQKVMAAATSTQALRARLMEEAGAMWFDGNAREQVKIRRAALYSDSMQQLNELGSKLKHQVQVSFINQHGAEEAGIDGGGVFKEFLDDLIKEGFAAKTDNKSSTGAPQLFSVTPLQTLAVNLDTAQDPNMLTHYEFLGRVLAKAVYESILVEPQFCLPFLNQLLAKPNTMEDLKNFDEEYYTNLSKLRQLSDTEIDSLGLTFELTIGTTTGATTGGRRSTGGRGRQTPRTVDLIPGGKSIAVEKKNVLQYIHLVAHQLLNIQGAQQTRAFLKGFRDLIPASWVRLFSANELQKLISGDDSVRGIDVNSLKASMHYLGGYHPSQPYIQDFWDILDNEFTPEQQRKFLKFMTSCSRQPLLGFSSLEPAPSIQQIRIEEYGVDGNDNDNNDTAMEKEAESSLLYERKRKNSKLPTSQTCLNLLKLPNYKDKKLLKEKLLAAIESNAGFELT